MENGSKWHLNVVQPLRWFYTYEEELPLVVKRELKKTCLKDFSHIFFYIHRYLHTPETDIIMAT